jgi:hypothetical protein
MHNTPHFIATSNGAIYKNYQSIPQNSPSAVLPVVEEKKELRCLCCCPSISDSCTDQARKKCYRLMLLGCFVWIRPGAGHN